MMNTELRTQLKAMHTKVVRLQIPLLSLLVICLCSCATVKIVPLTTLEYNKCFTEAPHKVKLVLNGQDALHERIAMIRSARTSIDLQTFIWEADESGTLVFYELAKAAERGVKVRLICDYLTVENDPAKLAAASTAEGVEIRLYRPISSNLRPSSWALCRSGLTSMNKLNKRMHSKLMVVDNAVGICGGRNISNKYFDESPDTNFKDMEIIVKGPVIQSMTDYFETFWTSSLSKDIRSFKDYKKALAAKESKKYNVNNVKLSDIFKRVDHALSDPAILTRLGSGYSTVNKIAFCGDDPQKNKNKGSYYGSSRFNELLVYSVLHARESMWIQTPYLVLSRRAKSVFKGIRKRNPNLDIRISTNSLASTDNWATYAFLYRNKRFVVNKLGITLYEFNPLPKDLYEFFPDYNRILEARTGKTSLNPEEIKTVSPKKHPFLCLHSKCMLIDDRISFIGSYNLDPRSANLNTELGIVIDDPKFATVLRSYFDKDLQAGNSWPVVKRKQSYVGYFITEVLEFVNSSVRTFTTLDLLPHYTYSCFELNEGGKAMLPGQAGFHKNYTARGNFPRVSSTSAKLLYSRLLKATGRFARPIL
jgi:putative cardiolipin synthase